MAEARRLVVIYNPAAGWRRRRRLDRVLDRLGALGLSRRVADPRDKRSVLVACTAEGFAFLRLVRDILVQAAETTAEAESDTPAAVANSNTGA